MADEYADTTADPAATRQSMVRYDAPSHTWKSAYGVLLAMIATIPLGIGFFLYEGVFALLSDLGGLLVGLVMAPLVWGLYHLHEDDPLNRPVFGIGAVTVAGICLGSFGLVVMYLLSLDPEILGTPFLGWILLGFWLLGIGVLGRRTGAVQPRTAWTAIVAGIGTAGGMVTLIYSYAVGSFTILFPLFIFVFGVGFLLWAFWLDGELRAKARRDSASSQRGDSA